MHDRVLIEAHIESAARGRASPSPAIPSCPRAAATEINMSKMFAAAGALLAAAALVLPTASQAEESNSMRVSYADLNLASTSGQGVLQHRMVGAAKIVCVIEDSREI